MRDEHERAAAKAGLLRRIVKALAYLREPSTDTPEEGRMRLFFGLTLMALGLIMIFLLGLTRAYTAGAESLIAMFLVFAGGITLMSGAGLARSNAPHLARLGQWVFAACFVASIALMIVGLVHIFNVERTVVSIYLIIMGFAEAVYSANRALN
jgi:hypothetical protein